MAHQNLPGLQICCRTRTVDGCLLIGYRDRLQVRSYSASPLRSAKIIGHVDGHSSCCILLSSVEGPRPVDHQYHNISCSQLSNKKPTLIYFIRA